ncbi:zinc finger MYM-type protein 1 [Artemisia annua]|uniref:Zinc finger MYM-type protein 1 n=1 Tax=Artemisia annua TaxID=35608 RepID=A0A2U1QAM1_ARTAN|nr:zinc finger MYM-type protein 1 [Artemisia annua]
MKIFKNRLRNKMSDENLANSMVIYIEKEIVDKFDSESIIEEFKGLKASFMYASIHFEMSWNLWLSASKVAGLLT